METLLACLIKNYTSIKLIFLFPECFPGTITKRCIRG